jgi:hypothetical protein
MGSPDSPAPTPRVALRIGVDQAFLEGAAPVGYAGRILDITPGRAPGQRQSKPVVVAVGYEASTSAEVGAGTYVVEAVSPSGTVLEEVVQISGDEGSVDVRLTGEERELRDQPGLAWQLLSGNIASATAPVAQAWRRLEERNQQDIKRQQALLQGLLGPRLGRIAHPALGVCAILLALRMSGWDYVGADSQGGIFQTLANDPLSWPLLLVLVVVMGVFAKASWDADRGKAPSASARSTARAEGAEPSTSTATASAIGSAGRAEPAAAAQAVSAFLFTTRGAANAARQLELAEMIAGDPSGVHAAASTAPLAPKEVEEGYWQLSIGKELLRAAARTGTRGSRFLIARALDGSAHMVVLPLPWESVDGSGPRPIDVLIGGASSPVSTTVADAQFATLLGYLSAGQMTEARLLAGAASDFLQKKLLNPFAAAAGAYALLSADDTQQRRPWRKWVGNLYKWFPQLPDGAVLQGWNLLQTAESDEAISRARLCFLEAADRGIPVFAEGVRRLAHGLSMFAAEDPDGRVKKASEAVEQLAIRCRPQQAFTTLRLGSLA